MPVSSRQAAVDRNDPNNRIGWALATMIAAAECFAAVLLCLIQNQWYIVEEGFVLQLNCQANISHTPRQRKVCVSGKKTDKRETSRDHFAIIIPANVPDLSCSIAVLFFFFFFFFHSALKISDQLFNLSSEAMEFGFADYFCFHISTWRKNGFLQPHILDLLTTHLQPKKKKDHTL